MSKKSPWTEKKIQQRLAAGRGKGTGPAYQPWLEVTDLSSLGDSRRIFSQKTGRIHHLLSKVEWQLFVLLEYAQDVIDIREQYPLDRDDTIAIAAQLGIKHPTYEKTKIEAVMTCDFLVTRQRGNGLILEAFDCKRTEDAEDARSIEKLEIQRSYLNGCGIAHHLIFHSMLPVAKVKNIEWIRGTAFNPDELEPYKDYYRDHCERLALVLAQGHQAGSLSDFGERYDTLRGALPGTGLRSIGMLLSQGRLTIDLNVPDITAAPVSMLHSVSQNRHVVGGQ